MSEPRSVQCIVALVTPFLENGAIDWVSLTHLVDWHLAVGTHAIVVTAVTGEASSLTQSEYAAIISRVCYQVDGRIPVWAGVGSPATAQVIENTRLAKSLGADAALVITPYHVKPTQRGLIAHYLAIADAVSLPLVVYNAPSRSACNLSAETVATLAAHPNIVGLKEASADAARVPWLRARVKPQFKIYTGDDAETLSFVRFGGDGVISVTANVLPEQMVRFCTEWSEGNTQEAEHIFEQLMPWHEAVFVETNPIPTKWALYRMGRIHTPNLRLPLTVLEAPGCAVMNRLLSTEESTQCV
ncbi:MAG: 4-hydroxy-tetrahydrodipicolinate synthase [Pseudomonadota bacterium]